MADEGAHVSDLGDLQVDDGRGFPLFPLLQVVVEVQLARRGLLRQLLLPVQRRPRVPLETPLRREY